MRPMTRARISVRVKAGARRDEFLELREGKLFAYVREPPLEGRANRAVCRLLAKRLGVGPSRVTIARGERAREKVIEVEGMDQATLDAALAP